MKVQIVYPQLKTIPNHFALSLGCVLGLEREGNECEFLLASMNMSLCIWLHGAQKWFFIY